MLLLLLPARPDRVQRHKRVVLGRNRTSGGVAVFRHPLLLLPPLPLLIVLMEEPVIARINRGIVDRSEVLRVMG